MSSMYAAHPWAKEGGDALDIPLDISVLSNMREFVKYSRLKQLALRVRMHNIYAINLGQLFVETAHLAYYSILNCHHASLVLSAGSG